LTFLSWVGLYWLVGALLVIQVVQLDPPASVTALWRTRPIPPLQMLASKLAFVLGVVAFPALASSALVLASQGVTPGDMLALAPRAVAMEMSILAAVLLAAALTRDMARAILLLVAGWALFVVSRIVVTALVPWSSWTWVRWFWWRTSWYEQGPALIVGAVALLAAAERYRSHRLGRVLALALAGLVVSHAGRPRWPAGPTAPGPASIELASGLSIALRQPITTRLEPPEARAPRAFVGLFQVSGLPDGHDAVPARTRAELRLPDGSRLTSLVGGMSSRPYRLAPGPFRDDDEVASSQLPAGTARARWSAPDLGVVEVVNMRPSWFRHDVDEIPWVMSLPREDYEARRPLAGTLSLEVTLDVVRWSLVARMPLAVGATYHVGSRRGRIERLEDTAQRWRTQSAGKEMLTILVLETGLAGTIPFSHYALYQPRRREIVLLQDLAGLPPSEYEPTTPLPFLMDWGGVGRYVGIEVPILADRAADREWLAGAELLRFERVAVGRTAQSLRTSDFRTDEGLP
jgi:hypothetical protein